MSSRLRAYFQAYIRGLKAISQSEHGPRLGCSGLLFAMLFIGMGLVFSFYTGNRVVLDCARGGGGEVGCLVQSRWYGLATIREDYLEDVQAANLDAYCDDEDCSYRIMLGLESAQIPLTEYYSANRTSKEATIQAMSAFLDDPQADRLTLQVGSLAEAGIANLLPLLLVGLGFLISFFSLRSLRPARTGKDPQPG